MFQNLGTDKYRFPLILTLEEVFFEMKTIITGFHQDEHEQWVADCHVVIQGISGTIPLGNKENGLHRLKVEKPI